MSEACRRSSGRSIFWRYWAASTISMTGTGVTTVALPLVAVIALKASSFQVSLVVGATYLSWAIVGLPAGALVARLRMRETQVAMDLTRAITLSSIPVAAAFHVLSLAQVVAVAFIVGLCSVIFDVANSTFVVSLVAKEELVSRNSAMTASSSTTQLVGPSLGGILIQAVGAPLSIVADIASYLVSGCLLGSLPRVGKPVPRPRDESIRRQIAEGMRFVLRHKVMRSATINATIFNFAAGAFLALTPLFLVRTLSARPLVVGLLYASEGVGGLIGALVTPYFCRELGTAGTLRTGTIIATVMCFFMPLAAGSILGYLVFAIGIGGFASGIVMVSIVSRTHRQDVSPRELLPRVMATVRFITWGIAPFGAATAGVLADTIGIRGAVWSVCCATALAPIALLASPVRSLRELHQPESAGAALA